MNSGETIIGYSVEGRPLSARQFGAGEHVILLVGGMHGGYEANTIRLMNELSIHFAANPQSVLENVTLVIVPVANPDGWARGETPEGRFNANGVDLNRNWGCDWSPEAVWRSMPVNPGARAFSEPESRALADFITELRPDAALFYHSAASGIFAGNCRGGTVSAAMALVLGEATGYRAGESFSAYPVSGTAASWADGQGIAAADVELTSHENSEFERNLRGVLAVQAWVTSDE